MPPSSFGFGQRGLQVMAGRTAPRVGAGKALVKIEIAARRDLRFSHRVIFGDEHPPNVDGDRRRQLRLIFWPWPDSRARPASGNQGVDKNKRTHCIKLMLLDATKMVFHGDRWTVRNAPGLRTPGITREGRFYSCATEKNLANKIAGPELSILSNRNDAGLPKAALGHAGLSGSGGVRKGTGDD